MQTSVSGTTLTVPETLVLDPAAPVGTPEEEGREERPRSPHSIAMEAIARRYEAEQRGHEIALGEELGHEAEARYAEEHPEEVQPQAAEGAADAGSTPSPERAPSQEQPASPAAAPGPSAAPQPRTISLQGQQFQVTDEQFQKLAEMGALANLAMAQQPVQNTPLPGYQQQQPAPQPRQEPGQAGPVLGADEAREIVQRLSYGSAEDGVAAIQQLADNLARRQAPAVDANQLAQHATQQALATIAFQNNLNQIGQEFPDVFNNQTRAYVAAIELTQLRQHDALMGRQRSDLELYREACQKVRDAMSPPQPQSGGENGSTAAQAAPTVAVNPSRLAGKRAAPRNPTAVSRSAGMGPAEPRPPSASQIIDQMRKARGQMSLS